MQYLISFLEGIITFISPCLLPMLPIYVSYFAGGGERSTARTAQGRARLRARLHADVRGHGRAGRDARQLSHPPPHGREHRARADRRVLWPQLSGRFPPEALQRRRPHAGAPRPRLLLRARIRRGVLRRLDALRGRFPRLRAGPRLAAGARPGRYAHAAALLPGPRPALHTQRPAHRQAENGLRLDQAPLWRYQHRLRRAARAHRRPDGHRDARPPC